MRAPTFLSLEEVLSLHADQIERYGGSVGVRDMGRLDAARARPGAMFGGALLHGTVAEMAAAYSFTSRKTIRSSTGTSAPRS